MPILLLYLNESIENQEFSIGEKQEKINFLLCDNNTHYSSIFEKISNFYENP
jgi:hypothetical protein